MWLSLPVLCVKEVAAHVLEEVLMGQHRPFGFSEGLVSLGNALILEVPTLHKPKASGAHKLASEEKAACLQGGNGGGKADTSFLQQEPAHLRRQ